jgi:hypothetical protein
MRRSGGVAYYVVEILVSGHLRTLANRKFLNRSKGVRKLCHCVEYNIYYDFNVSVTSDVHVRSEDPMQRENDSQFQGAGIIAWIRLFARLRFSIDWLLGSRHHLAAS